jgi:rhodanese-related sulfurtransferase
MQENISRIKIVDEPADAYFNQLDPSLWIVDVREEGEFKKGHLPHAVNIMASGQLETWLGSIIKPGEKFYLAAANVVQLNAAIRRTTSIGYETSIEEGFIVTDGPIKGDKLDIAHFRDNPSSFTIVDVRNKSEVSVNRIFPNSISIPLHKLRERINEIPVGKSIVVHCAGGYRSAAGSSLVHELVSDKTKVFDLGEAIKTF